MLEYFVSKKSLGDEMSGIQETNKTQASLVIIQLNNATMTYFSSSSRSGILNYFREFAGR